MNLNSHTGNILVPPRDIRRYPTELDLVPSLRVVRTAEVGRGPTFSEVAVGVNSVNRVAVTPTEPPAVKNGKQFALWEKDGFGFADFIDIINPLQHIPVVATIYRNFSGDQIGAAPRVIGGALWGRIGGFVTGLANAVVEWWSGKDIGDHIYAAMFGPANKDPNAVPVAQKTLMPSGGAVTGSVTSCGALPRSSYSFIVKSAEPPVTVCERDAIGPNALRSETVPISRVARNSYERNRSSGEPDDSLGLRFPA